MGDLVHVDHYTSMDYFSNILLMEYTVILLALFFFFFIGFRQCECVLAHS